MERSGREHRVEDLLRKRKLLESAEMELDGRGITDALARERDHVRTGIDRIDHEPAFGKCLGQLAGAGADLQHP